MDPQHPSRVVDPDPEEPLEALDYYEAMRGGYLTSDDEEDVGPEITPFESPTE